MGTRTHQKAMAFVYMNPKFLEEYLDSISPEELANHIEYSFSVPGNDVNRERLVEQMEGGIEKHNIDEDDKCIELWVAAIKIIKARGEYM